MRRIGYGVMDAATRLDSNVMAVLLYGLVAGQFRMSQATDGNRTRQERAPAGSREEAWRKLEAAERRKRRLAKRSQSAKEAKQS